MRAVVLLLEAAVGWAFVADARAGVRVGVDVDGAVRMDGVDVIVNGSSRLLAAITRLEGHVGELSVRMESVSTRLDTLASVTQWGCWGVCEGTCGQPGMRRRVSSVPAGLEDRIGCESPCFPEWRKPDGGRAGGVYGCVAEVGCAERMPPGGRGASDDVWEHINILPGRHACTERDDLRASMGYRSVLED
jgi:hypothetical protein